MITCLAVWAAIRPKSSLGSRGKTSSSPGVTPFFIRRAVSTIMCFSGSKRTFFSSDGTTASSCSVSISSSSSSGFSMLSSTTIFTCSKFTVPVDISKAARTIWPRLPNSFLYAVAKACSIASIIRSRGIPRSSSISRRTEFITFKSNIFEFSGCRTILSPSLY